MGLFDLLKKKKEVASPKELNVFETLATPAKDLEHLDENGDFPWGWHTHNKEFIEKINQEYTYFLNMWLDSKGKEPKKQYEALKSFVLYLEDIEKICKSKGECFELWFNEVLVSPGYLEERRKELNHLTENFDSIEKLYYKKK